MRVPVATSSSSSVCARFDGFQVDLSSGDLRTPEATSVRIQQQPLQVLRLLLEGEGRVVTREQLRVALWPDDTFVDFEHGVNTAVKKLRQALGDSVETPKFVETVPKVGYRFLVPVEWVTRSGRQASTAHACVSFLWRSASSRTEAREAAVYNEESRSHGPNSNGHPCVALSLSQSVTPIQSA